MNRNKKILLENVTKSFSNKIIIDDINLSIDCGEIIILSGANGSGKSTILKIISGLLHQDQGNVTVFGVSNKSKNIHKVCEYVMESGQGYYGYLSAYENARYFFGLSKIKFKLIEHKFYKLCDLFEFTPHLHKKIDELSQGNRQKISLIVSILSNPKVLLLDEPTNGLDAHSIHVLANIITDLSKNKHVTTIVTSHDTLFMKAMKTRIIRVDTGLITSDEVNEFVKEPLLNIFEISLAITEKKKFKKLYPNIKIDTYNDDTFSFLVDEKTKNSILKIFEVIRLVKANELFISGNKGIE